MARISKPYFGVTGFKTADQIRQVLAVFPETEDRVLMAGVLIHRSGQPSNRYPTAAERGTIFFPDPRVMNLVHFNSDQKTDLSDQMEWAMDAAGKHCHGIQLNVFKPDARELYRFSQQRPEATVVLQISVRALRLPPTTLAATVAFGYAGFVHYILLDPSGGTGQALNPEAILPHLDALLTLNNPDLLIGVAGGLCAETLHTIAPIISRYSKVSIDAEGKLHSPPPGDAFQVSAAQAYVQTAAKLLLV